MKDRILILGSSGQIGAPLVSHLKSHNYDVIEFDVVRSVDEDLRINKNPILEREVIDADFVIFLAFDIGGSFYMKKYQNTYGFIHNNTQIMENSFEALYKHSKPFIFASSQMSNMSYSTYGRLKAVGESYTTGLGGMIVKFWNVYGVERDKDKAHVITDFIDMANNRGKIIMRSNGLESRQFLHADDCSNGLRILLESYTDIDYTEELHLTSFEWITVYDLANIISDYYGGIPIVPSDDEDVVQKDAMNEPDGYILDFWEPKISIKTGIEKVIEDMSWVE